MRVIPLSRAPNQSFTVTIDGVRWVMGIKALVGAMCVDISRDGVTLLSGSRALAGEALIPYRYLQTGNFIFVVTGDEMPDWQLFGVSQVLIFLTAFEIAALPQITMGEILAAQQTVGYLTTDAGFYITTDTGGLLTDD